MTSALPGSPALEGAGDLVVESSGVEIQLWRHRPLMTQVRRHLRDEARGAMAICSINIDHFHHFGEGRLQLPADEADPQVTWLMVADGAPVAWRAARAGHTSWPRLTGADLLPQLLDLASDLDCTVGFLGGTPEIHDRLQQVLVHDYPWLQIAGFWAPEREEIDSEAGSEAIADAIAAVGVDMLVVALGKPRQELWIDRYGDRTGARVLLAFGASADFIAGKTRRAPDWMQRLGLEWAYRLGSEPRRLARRYLVQGPPALARLMPAQAITPDESPRSPVAPALPTHETGTHYAERRRNRASAPRRSSRSKASGR